MILGDPNYVVIEYYLRKMIDKTSHYVLLEDFYWRRVRWFGVDLESCWKDSSFIRLRSFFFALHNIGWWKYIWKQKWASSMMCFARFSPSLDFSKDRLMDEEPTTFILLEFALLILFISYQPSCAPQRPIKLYLKHLIGNFWPLDIWHFACLKADFKERGWADGKSEVSATER